MQHYSSQLQWHEYLNKISYIIEIRNYAHTKKYFPYYLKVQEWYWHQYNKKGENLSRRLGSKMSRNQ